VNHPQTFPFPAKSIPDDGPPSMFDRIVLIMNIFEHSSGALTLGQISTRSQLPRSTVHRIIRKLLDAGWLERNSMSYTLGLRMFEMGSQVRQSSRIIHLSRPLLQQLRANTGHVVHLAVLDDQDVVYLEKLGGSFANTLPSKVGGRLPAHCTAVGKALLAYSPTEVVDQYAAQGLRRQTSPSIATGRELKAAMDRIRSTEYSAEASEAVTGVQCIGAPIFECGRPVASISVCGPAQEFNVNALKHRVLRTAAEISQHMTRTSFR
jgi:DNA-binding IclR family transcriptional regulator